MEFKLTPVQHAHIRERFAATVDLRKEFIAAREYLAMHTGRPYKNLGLFFWKWCLRAESWGKKPERRLGYHAKPPEWAKDICGQCGRGLGFCECGKKSLPGEGSAA
jgi:hypothetical protein